MKQTNFNLGTKKPDIEVNKPSDIKFWQRPNVTLVLYLLFFAATWFMWQSGSRMAQEEIPYSQFLAYVDQDQVGKVVVTESLISGTLKIADEKSGQPREADGLRIAAASLTFSRVTVMPRTPTQFRPQIPDD